MNNLEKMQKVFEEVFGVEASVLDKNFTSDKVEKWDSVTQMTLVSTIEEQFDIMLDIDDIFDLNSFESCKSILRKYEVEI